MNDYTQGAIEALSWIHSMLENGVSSKEIKNRIDVILKTVKRGIGRDFQWRLEATI